MAAGAAIASSNTAAATSSAYSAGVAAGSANTASAYNAGVATGYAAGASTSYMMGGNYATLPPGAMSINKGGTTYYLSGNTWFQPAYGANGVYYRVVPAP
jgi:hypothetical protein